MNSVITNILPLADDLSMRTRWYIYLRWFILLTIIVPGLISIYIGQGWSEKLQFDALLGLIALGTNAVFYLLGRWLKNNTALQTLVTLIFVVDIALITYFIYTKGGIESRSVIIYVIPIIMSAAIFGRNGAYVFALLAMVAYDALIIGNYFGLYPSLDPVNVGMQTDFPSVINTIIFFNSLIILISLTVDFIAQLLIKRERQATSHLNDLKRAQAIAKFGSWEWEKDADAITWSEELYHIFGVAQTSDPITFEQYLSYIHPDDRKMLLDKIDRASKKAMLFSFEHRAILPDNTVRYIHSNGQSISDESGRVTRMIGTARDITDAKLLEDAKNDFVALTSHQLRTPATIVKQYATMLSEGYAGELTGQQKSFLKIIYDSNERQITIINDLLNIARIDSGDFTMNIQRTDLVALFSEIATQHSAKYRTKKQKILFKPKYKNIYCDVDKDQLRMAVENLLDNAHKYTPEGKTVRIELKRKKLGVLISVIDEGIGIPAQDKHKIFNMFSRINNPSVLQEEGTGIGLYWAKKIVTMHGGTIAVDSEHNKGTTFTIELPYAVDKT